MQIVCKGEIVSLLGRNGAGKSTTMRRRERGELGAAARQVILPDQAALSDE